MRAASRFRLRRAGHDDHAGAGRVFQGFETWAQAVTSGAIRVDGPPRLVKLVPRLFLWSPFVTPTLARTSRAQAAALAG